MRILFLLFPLLLMAEPFHTQKQIETLSSSVVKIYTFSVKADYNDPWKMNSQTSSTGSGVIIDNHFILTSAHVVDNAVRIEVKKSAYPKKYISNVKWISHEADLALLEIEDESFFDNTKALQFDGLPRRQTETVVYGYPRGGNEISITQGIVSRIEQARYIHSKMYLLTIQIDAAINPGNSGGPAFDKEGNIVGIAMQKLKGSSNIGYLVPTPVIKHFLDDIKDGTYDGFPCDGFFVQSMENDTLKKHYGMKDRSGVIIRKVLPNNSSDGYLQKGDVLLEIDGISVADDYTIPMEGNGRIAADYPIHMHQIGETFEATILRDSKEMKIDIPSKKRKRLIPYEHEKRPEYYIFAGMIFMPLTMNYFYEWGSDWKEEAPIRLLKHYINGDDKLTKTKTGLVILKGVLSDRENVGYGYANRIVEEVNGVTINTFKDLVTALEKSEDEDVTITLEGDYVIILNKQKAMEANERLLKRNGIEHSSYVRMEE